MFLGRGCATGLKISIIIIWILQRQTTNNVIKKEQNPNRSCFSMMNPIKEFLATNGTKAQALKKSQCLQVQKIKMNLTMKLKKKKISTVWHMVVKVQEL
jgi:hypothetical protein